MTAREALQLTAAHNLGSTRNTLVPGVSVPAFTSGMDPNQWISRVQAIGKARTQPAGTATSLFKYGNVPGSFDIGSSAPGSSTIMIPKTEEEKQQAINLLMSTMSPSAGETKRNASGAPVSDFSSGSYIFGNDIGSMQSNMLSSATLLENSRQAARRDALAAQAQANALQAQKSAAAQAQRDFNFRQQQASDALKHTGFAEQLALIDQQNRTGQLSFEDQLKIAQVTGQNADSTAYSTEGRAAISGLQDASSANATAQSAYNAKILAAASAEPAGVQVVYDSSGRASFKSGSGSDPAITNRLWSMVSQSPEYSALVAAQTAMTAADARLKSLPYMARQAITAPVVPTFRTAGGGFPMPTGATGFPMPAGGATAAPASLAVPFALQDARSSASLQAAYERMNTDALAEREGWWGVDSSPAGASPVVPAGDGLSQWILQQGWNNQAPAPAPTVLSPGVKTVGGMWDAMISGMGDATSGVGNPGDFVSGGTGATLPGSVSLAEFQQNPSIDNIRGLSAVDRKQVSDAVEREIAFRGSIGDTSIHPSTYNDPGNLMDWSRREPLPVEPPENRQAAINAYLQSGGMPWWNDQGTNQIRTAADRLIAQQQVVAAQEQLAAMKKTLGTASRKLKYNPKTGKAE